MSDYDYLNARVRGMSSRLLDRSTFEDLLQSRGEDVLLDVLMELPYGEELRDVLGGGFRLEAVEDALRRNLSATVHRLLSLAPERPRELLAVQVNRWDVQNVITILRGKLHASAYDEIMSSMVPAGQFGVAQLEELVSEEEAADVADALTTWNYEFSFPIRRSIRENIGGGDIVRLETLLLTEYFQWAFSRLSPEDENEAILRKHLQLQTDLINVVGSLHMVSMRERHEAASPRERIPGGLLSGRVLDEIEGQPNVAMALEILEGTYFAPAVERGILIFGQTNQLSDFERFIETVVMDKGMRLFRGEPFSIAVPLGYLWRKVNEYINLRLILRGLFYEVPPNVIKEQMFFV